ncbi:MAG: hypothetical protein NTX61_04320 [Bacteroidetes bacterium]|nr:hypothetical protein [Bacteroidota bacterium]
MKKNVLFITLVFFIVSAGAQTTDYLQKKDFQSEKNKIYSNLNSAKKAALEVKKLISRQNVKIDSLNNVIAVFSAKNAQVTDMAGQMSLKVTAMEEKVDATNGKLTSNLLIALIVTGVVFLILLVIFLMQWRKAMAGYHSIHDEYLRLNEKLDKEIAAIRIELKDCLGLINSNSRNLDLKISDGILELTGKNELINQKLLEQSAYVQDQLKKTAEQYESKLQGIRSEFETKREEILSQVDKNIQSLSSELKKIKSS